MTKNITLTISERLAALRIFDQFKGSITDLASLLDDVKKVSIPLADWEKAQRVITKGEDGKTESWKWNDEDPETFKDVELSQSSIDYLVKTIKEKSDKGEVTLADVSLISLNKKLS